MARFLLYNKPGNIIGRFVSRAAAVHAYENWAEAWSLFDGDELIRSKW